MEPFVGQIILVPYNFCPDGFFPCDGQTLPISQYQVLYSLLGTTFGGNGTTTFGLPDLRGRAPIHVGQAPGLAPRVLGEAGGAESHTLTAAEMPVHNHTMAASTTQATTTEPQNQFPSAGGAYAATAQTALNAAAVGNAGSSVPHNNMPPFLVMRYCIAHAGIYPSRP
jgi:microcystin-dependent protein